MTTPKRVRDRQLVVSLHSDTIKELGALTTRLRISKSAVVDMAVREMAARMLTKRKAKGSEMKMEDATMVTIENVTKAQVRRLRTEALEAGDSARVDICDTALGTWSDQPQSESEVKDCRCALVECVRVIREAEAQP